MVVIRVTDFVFLLFGKVPGWRWPAGWLAWELPAPASLPASPASLASSLVPGQPGGHLQPRTFPKRKKKTVDVTQIVIFLVFS